MSTEGDKPIVEATSESSAGLGVETGLQVKREMFRFESEIRWVNKAQSWFKNCGVPRHRYICTDAKGRVCVSGREFMRATAEDTYPIVVYEIL